MKPDETTAEEVSESPDHEGCTFCFQPLDMAARLAEVEAERDRLRDGSRWQHVVKLEAEIDRLRDWKASAIDVMSGLQDLGRALGVPPGHSITASESAQRAADLRARAEKAEEALRWIADVERAETADPHEWAVEAHDRAHAVLASVPTPEET